MSKEKIASEDFDQQFADSILEDTSEMEMRVWQNISVPAKRQPKRLPFFMPYAAVLAAGIGLGVGIQKLFYHEKPAITLLASQGEPQNTHRTGISEADKHPIEKNTAAQETTEYYANTPPRKVVPKDDAVPVVTDTVPTMAPLPVYAVQDNSIQQPVIIYENLNSSMPVEKIKNPVQTHHQKRTRVVHAHDLQQQILEDQTFNNSMLAKGAKKSIQNSQPDPEIRLTTRSVLKSF